LTDPRGGEDLPAGGGGPSEGGSTGSEPFLEWLMDTHLYSIGAFFSDSHPELVDEVISESEAIESRGLARYAQDEGITLETCFQTLITGLAVRYFKAVSG
jgi:hypothetical protein